jgi:hypothetical protein
MILLLAWGVGMGASPSGTVTAVASSLPLTGAGS